MVLDNLSRFLVMYEYLVGLFGVMEDYFYSTLSREMCPCLMGAKCKFESHTCKHKKNGFLVDITVFSIT